MAEPRGMVILGGGHTGGRAARALREAGWKGPVTVISAEPTLPYERPPLSKGMLTGEKALADFALYDEDAWRRSRSTISSAPRWPRSGAARARWSSPTARAIPYERLLLATGAAPRRLAIPGADLAGVSVLRDLADSEALRARLGPGRRLVIIGGGFIGLEVAATRSGSALPSPSSRPARG